MDRFILMKIGREADPNLINENEIYDKGKEVANRKKWLIDSGKGALDYKMRIEPIDAVNSIPIMYSTTNDGKFRPNFPTIFGNVDSHQKKVFRFAEKQKLTITCTKVELSDKFNQWIGMFFSLNNFGFRQSKGFGSFTIDNKSMVLGSKLFFTLNHGITEYYEVFRDIDLFYRCLKSGINIKTREDPKDKKSKLIDKMYLKSLMFKFAKSLSKPEQWDKRTIRHALFLNNYKYKDDKKEDGIFYNRRNPDGTVQFTVAQAEGTNYFDFRDLLGLSTEQDWLFILPKLKKVFQNPLLKMEKMKKCK
ncbi:MAG: hypothetical protein IPJ51_21275 [Saprospiraceae bacterium]|nr:hypothetical protein [Saprospiraceae bacterium]